MCLFSFFLDWKPFVAKVFVGKMWKTARSKVTATMAFGGPLTFGKRLSGASAESVKSMTPSDFDGCATGALVYRNSSDSLNATVQVHAP